MNITLSKYQLIKHKHWKLHRNDKQMPEGVKAGTEGTMFV